MTLRAHTNTAENVRNRTSLKVKVTVKVKFSLEEAREAQRRNRDIALIFL
jgi:hypothetical protein